MCVVFYVCTYISSSKEERHLPTTWRINHKSKSNQIKSDQLRRLYYKQSLKQLYTCTTESTNFINPQALSRALTVLGCYSLGPLCLQNSQTPQCMRISIIYKYLELQKNLKYLNQCILRIIRAACMCFSTNIQLFKVIHCIQCTLDRQLNCLPF